MDSPIFIISLERSGSTLLRNILDAHPAIFSPAQLNIGKLCQWTYFASYYSIAQVYSDMLEDERRTAAIEETRNSVHSLMHGFASKMSKRIWCDKSTTNIENLDILKDIFPDARFICLYRNCLDLVYSHISVSRLGVMEEVAAYVRNNPMNFVSSMSDNWIDRTGDILDFESRGDARCHRVTYESLVSDTQETLNRIFDFLELELDEELLDRTFSNQGKGPIEGDIKFQFSSTISTDSIGQGDSIPLTYIPKRQMKRINELLIKLGYTPIGIDVNPTEFDVNSVREAVLSNESENYTRHLFRSYFPERIKARIQNFHTLNCICKMLVSGKGGGIWTFDLTKPGGEVREENADAICAIGVSSEVLRKIVDGEIAVVNAFQEGLIGASGDIRIAINFGRLLFD